MLHPLLQQRISQITDLFRENKVKRAFAFGSVCTPEFGSKSDVDLLISFQDGLDPLQRGENWWNLFYALRKLLNRDIDLLVESDLQNPYLIEAIEESKQRIYG